MSLSEDTIQQIVDFRCKSGRFFERMTAREHDIAILISDGYTNKQIGASLNITPGTVKVYISRMMDKFKMRSRLDIALSVITANILKDPDRWMKHHKERFVERFLQDNL